MKPAGMPGALARAHGSPIQSHAHVHRAAYSEHKVANEGACFISQSLANVGAWKLELRDLQTVLGSCVHVV